MAARPASFLRSSLFLSFYTFSKRSNRRGLHQSLVLFRQSPVVHHTDVSYVRGPSSPPLVDLTIGETLSRAAETWPDREALVVPFQQVRRTFREVLEEVDRLAAGLLGLGLEPGDRLGMWGPNSHEWYLTQFAAARAGLVLVNVNPAYQPAELRYALNKVGVSGIVSSERFKTQEYHSMLAQVAPELTHSRPGQVSSPAVPSLR